MSAGQEGHGEARPIESFIEDIAVPPGEPVSVTLRCGQNVVHVTTRAALVISCPEPGHAVLMGDRHRIPDLVGRALRIGLRSIEQAVLQNQTLRDELARVGWTYTPPPPPTSDGGSAT